MVFNNTIIIAIFRKQFLELVNEYPKNNIYRAKMFYQELKDRIHFTHYEAVSGINPALAQQTLESDIK
jgi:hypothetical protein